MFKKLLPDKSHYQNDGHLTSKQRCTCSSVYTTYSTFTEQLFGTVYRPGILLCSTISLNLRTKHGSSFILYTGNKAVLSWMVYINISIFFTFEKLLKMQFLSFDTQLQFFHPKIQIFAFAMKLYEGYVYLFYIVYKFESH